MNIIKKITLSALIIIIGMLISAVVKDIMGTGQHLTLAITAVLVFYLWGKS